MLQHVKVDGFCIGPYTIYAWRFGGSRDVSIRFLFHNGTQEKWDDDVMVEPMPQRFGTDLKAFLDWLYYVDTDTFVSLV